MILLHSFCGHVCCQCVEDMPPKKKSQSSTSKETCCVCCQPIVIGKDESLFCGGKCQQWLHRYCAGVSAEVFKGFSGKDATFFCFACFLERHRKEIDALKDIVELLICEITNLKFSSVPPPATSSFQYATAATANASAPSSPAYSQPDCNPS